MPDSLKTALITPLLKKASLDPEVLKNVRPVSNLTYISKLIERVVANRLLAHMDMYHLHEPMQSAYKKHHSIETALLHVQNDIFLSIDSHNCVLLVLLDLSAAFDTVDHSILLTRLATRFGVCGKALDWFRSYLSDRKQAVTINRIASTQHDLQCGVPQGSVLGPILFTNYTAPLGDIMRSHITDNHLYADDTQMYREFRLSSTGEPGKAIQALEQCICDVRVWMAKNFLKLNDDKTEFMVIGSSHLLKKLSQSMPSITIGDHVINPSASARNIGAVFDANMKLSKHVDTICSSSWFHLRNIGKIRKYLNTTTTEMLVHSFISSKLDQSNSLLYGLPATQLGKLQRVQNSAARVVLQAKKFDHVTPIFLKLHWLPIPKRIEFKILLITYKALCNQAPGYIRTMLEPYTPVRSLRSSDKSLLVIPKTRLVTYGDRSFSHAAPTLWNKLPIDIRNSSSVQMFKGKLKTYLFKQAYNVCN
jgi:hypothetical protein